MSLQDNLDRVMKPDHYSALKLQQRHPSTQHMIKALAPNPNLTGDLAPIAHECYSLGDRLMKKLPDGPELTAGLRKLLEAKDCFVRAALDTEPPTRGYVRD